MFVRFHVVEALSKRCRSHEATLLLLSVAKLRDLIDKLPSKGMEFTWLYYASKTPLRAHWQLLTLRGGQSGTSQASWRVAYMATGFAAKSFMACSSNDENEKVFSRGATVIASPSSPVPELARVTVGM